MISPKVRVDTYLPGFPCPKCEGGLPVRLLRSHDEIVRYAFLGWGGYAEKVLEAHDIPQEMLIRECKCGYIELNYPVDSGRKERLVLEVKA
jgi:hypothetical protein